MKRPADKVRLSYVQSKINMYNRNLAKRLNMDIDQGGFQARFLISKRGVPYLECYVRDRVRFTICWFNKSQMWRLFNPAYRDDCVRKDFGSGNAGYEQLVQYIRLEVDKICVSESMEQRRTKNLFRK
ncbi:MAG: hypothetical protein GYA55_03775 [SAR324 cluster bacterium]|uniref:Uncharacterized protein n=1 Tax=SAR324 cluster bacterium TaxID=2024889 RepID=A0A7X9FQB7_9DELT|nr:hypothetical protein [SAR324 cluster bacterium]